MVDWKLWLTRYEKPGSPHSQRLVTVRRLIDRRIDRTAPRPISILSICAGDGRDVLQVLANRADASRAKTTLVELDPRLCVLARAHAVETGIRDVVVKQADAGITDTYAGVPLADLVLLVGVFGNIADADVATTVSILRALCRPNALIVWSLRQKPRRPEPGRLRQNDYERVEKVRGLFTAEGFQEVHLTQAEPVFYVGAHRFVGEPIELPAGHRFFMFDATPSDALTGR